MTTTTKERRNDVIVKTTIEETPAIVDFQDLLDACRIEEDNDYDAPWQAQDGYEHYLTSGRQLGDDDPYLDTERADTKEMRGYCWVDSGGNSSSGTGVVTIKQDHAWRERWGIGFSGASKQVLREMNAQNVQRTIDQLVSWYSYGWQWYGVVCEYGEYQESCWGIDDYKFAAGEMARELALDVAAQMEQDGYTIENLPTADTNHAEHRQQIRANFKYKLSLDCWQEYDISGARARHQRRHGKQGR